MRIFEAAQALYSKPRPYPIVPLRLHHPIPLPHYGQKRLLVVRPVHLGDYLVLHISIERFRQKLDSAVVPRLLARDRNRTPQLDPRNCQYRTTVAVRECNCILFVVIQNRNYTLSYIIHAYGEPQELGLGVNVGIKADALVVVFSVEG